MAKRDLILVLANILKILSDIEINRVNINFDFNDLRKQKNKKNQ